MRMLVCAVAAATALGLAPVAVASAAAPVVSANLIKNGNAEAGAGSIDGSVVTVPSWTIVSGTTFTAVQYAAGGGFPTSADPGPANRGENFFAGGPSDGLAVATQETVLPAAFRSAIHDGVATFVLQGYLGGFAGQEDNATLSIEWRSGRDKPLGTASIGPVTSADRSGLTGLLRRKATGAIPVNARKVVITLTLTRTSGSYDDGYADSLSLKIRMPAAG